MEMISNKSTFSLERVVSLFLVVLMLFGMITCNSEVVNAEEGGDHTPSTGYLLNNNQKKTMVDAKLTLNGNSSSNLFVQINSPNKMESKVPVVTNKDTTDLSSTDFKVNFRVDNPGRVLLERVGTIVIGPTTSYNFYDDLKGSELANSHVLGSSYLMSKYGLTVTEGTSYTVQNYVKTQSGQMFYGQKYTVSTPSEYAIPYSVSVSIDDSRFTFSFKVSQGTSYKANECGFELFDSNGSKIGGGNDSGLNYSGNFSASYDTAKYYEKVVLWPGDYYAQAYVVSGGQVRYSNRIPIEIKISTTEGRINAFLRNPKWEDGAKWGGRKSYTNPIFNAWGCCAYTLDLSRVVFNQSYRNGRTNTNISNIRKYDVVKLHKTGGSDHWLFIRDIKSDGKLDVLEATTSDGGGRVFVTSYRWKIDYDSNTFQFQHDDGNGYTQTYNFISSWHQN